MNKININDILNAIIRKWTNWYYIPVYVKNIWESLDEKVAMKSWDPAKYLEDLIDDDYIKSDWNVIYVNDIYWRLRDDIRYNQNQSNWDYTIPDNTNAMVVWPYTIRDWDTITIWNNSVFKII